MEIIMTTDPPVSQKNRFESAPRAVDAFNVLALNIAKTHLEEARDSCRVGGATQTLRKIRSALKSIDGAIRHAEGISARTEAEPLDRARRLVAGYPKPRG